MPSRSSTVVRLIATGWTSLAKTTKSPVELMQDALVSATNAAGVSLRDIGGLIAVPSLADPHFMEAHYVATHMGILPAKNVVVRTVDTGGAGPVTALLAAKRMVEYEGVDCVAVVAGDAVRQLSGDEFLRRADQTCYHPASGLSSPVIPSGYDRIARYQMDKFGVTRAELAACSAVMSIMASQHPLAMTKVPRTIEEVLASPPVASVTNLLECARRADGGAALLVASPRFLERKGIPASTGAVIIGGGEASGPLYPPALADINEDMFSCEQATKMAYQEANVSVRDIDFFGLYDCYPVCLIRAVEAVGLADQGEGGRYILGKYHELVANPEKRPQDILPINTHGGLLAFGAPWEVPAMYNIIEAFHQITNTAATRQIPNVRRALVYGNGGIFSHSAVAILGNGVY
ncbi:hypothetical protein SPRG_17674 [Saprolegnia parasitica CBS 223.65]|uniref:Thiolase C-terminal domain-containing protein n=1 Tax=Saprolegnia parasitica (strain CBS 223.65) TaxID=695850 RepID=A0A067BF29_SAPPC|nr:hypothetical protein SPRG_17674 [Saprolegnia parasitica CBS 223.65]KDO16688.1 hypothetical protein SPRG_17674 [Saprolegnia parasitica CBS 223.65]|eukprot:XP_012212604.1 hypothetical protein SPRG_17674 [Saprolegnia parasitica CBS 223.65]